MDAHPFSVLAPTFNGLLDFTDTICLYVLSTWLYSELSISSPFYFILLLQNLISSLYNSGAGFTFNNS